MFRNSNLISRDTIFDDDFDANMIIAKAVKDLLDKAPKTLGSSVEESHGALSLAVDLPRPVGSHFGRVDG